MYQAPYLIAKSKISEALIIAGHNRNNLQNYYAITGKWPPAGKLEVENPYFKTEAENPYLESIMHDGNGGIHATMSRQAIRKGGRTLSLRPEMNLLMQNAPILWRCGYSQQTKGYTTLGENKTDISESLLSPVLGHLSVRIHNDS